MQLRYSLVSSDQLFSTWLSLLAPAAPGNRKNELNHLGNTY